MIAAEHGRRFGAVLTDDGVRFSLWAPTAAQVELALDDRRIVMPEVDQGWHEVTVRGLRAGARYDFVIDGNTRVPDPASRFQPDGVFMPSQVVDPSAWRWNTTNWSGRSWREAVIWEAHVGAATTEGTWAGLAARLPHLRDLGITAIEIMPVSECPGKRNWGYDGVLPFAPRASYGTPEDMAAFVDAAHAHGIMVLLDVVYNHFGPSGNFLHLYAEPFFTQRHQTPWGAGVNFDGAGSSFVRRFFIENALSWINDYRIDGLRLDAVHAILDDGEKHFLAELAQDIRSAAGNRHVHLVLENEHNRSRWLERREDGCPRSYTAQWNDDFHHCWHVLLTGESEGYYGAFAEHGRDMLLRSLAEGFVFQGEDMAPGRHRGEPSAHLPPTAFVSFLQNHDQIGNRGFGERLTELSEPRKLALATEVLLLAPQTPMLFMGEEWGTRTPFLYFVDFAQDPALSQAIREGRQKEFAAFAAFADHGASETVPDPTSESTFERSRLDWSEPARAPFAAVLERTRILIAHRARELVPLIASGWNGAKVTGRDPIDVTWRFGAGAWRLILNIADSERRLPRPNHARIVHLGDGASVDGNEAVLAPWACMFLREDSLDHG